MCAYIHTDTNIHTYIHASMHAFMLAYMQYAFSHTHVCACVHVWGVCGGMCVRI